MSRPCADGAPRGSRRRDPACARRGRTAAPSPSVDRPCRRGTASPRRRPSGGLRYPLTMSATHAIGVDLGGTKILAGIVTRGGEVLRRHERATPKTQEELFEELDAAVEELLTDDVAALGFGIPGPVNQLTGQIYEAVNTPIADTEFRGRMRDRFELPDG